VTNFDVNLQVQALTQLSVCGCCCQSLLPHQVLLLHISMPTRGRQKKHTIRALSLCHTPTFA